MNWTAIPKRINYATGFCLLWTTLVAGSCDGTDAPEDKTSDLCKNNTGITVTIHTGPVEPAFYRNIGCGAADTYDVKDGDISAEISLSGTNDSRPLQESAIKLKNDTVEITFPENDGDDAFPVAGQKYTIDVILPNGSFVTTNFTYEESLEPCEETSTDNVLTVDTDSKTPNGDDTETISDTDTTALDDNTPATHPDDTDTSVDTGSDTGTGNAVDTDTDTRTNTFEDSNSEVDTNTDIDTEYATDPLHIEAECAFDEEKSDCLAAFDGRHPTGIVDTDSDINIPNYDRDRQVVEYMREDAYIAFDNINFTDYRSMRIKYASANPGGNLSILINALEQDTPFILATLNTFTGSWDEFDVRDIQIEPYNGSGTLYIWGGAANKTTDDNRGNADIDWLELSTADAQPDTEVNDTEVNDTEVNDTEVTACAAYSDCHTDCKTCATADGGYCEQKRKDCIDNNWDCAEIVLCIESNCAAITESNDATACFFGCINHIRNVPDEFWDYRNCVMCHICKSQCNGLVSCTEDYYGFPGIGYWGP